MLVIDENIKKKVGESKVTNDRIAAAGDCAMIMNTYSREWGTKASLVIGWTDRYKITLATNIKYTAFK